MARRWRRSVGRLYLCDVREVSARAADNIDVKLDQASLLKLPANVTTVVIGNPAITDAAMQPGGLLVITGKGYGSTNLITLDRAGENCWAFGRGYRPRDNRVVVYRGVEREILELPHAAMRTAAQRSAIPSVFDSTVTAGRRTL